MLWPDHRAVHLLLNYCIYKFFLGHNLRARCFAWIRGDSHCASQPFVKMKKAIANRLHMLIPARFGKAASHALAICFGLSLVAGRLFAAYTPPTALQVIWAGVDQSSTCHQYNDYITNVTFAGINNTTAVGTFGWHFDYGRTTPQVAPGVVVPGQSYPISITVTGQDLGCHYLAVYIDWNQNNINGTTAYPYILDANENPVAWSNYTGSGSKTLTGTINVPVGIAPGNIYMRVMLDADSGGSNGGDYTCAIGCGEFEDYVLTVVVPSLPTVTITAPSAITATSATLGGNVTADGGATVSERGVVYSTTDSTPTIAEGATKVVIDSGTGSFSKSVGSLARGTTYYVNAYATNSIGTSYGAATSFTPGAPTLTKPTTSNLGANQVTLTFQSSATGTGYFTLLPYGDPVGTPAQTADGQNASGTSAYRHGSLPLTAATNGSYTVSNLSAATHYTVCFTADDGSALAGVDASVSFTTAASANLTGLDWVPVGAAHFSTSLADRPDLAFAPDGTPYVAFGDGAHGSRTSVMKYSGSSWVYVGAAGFSAGQPGDLNLAIAPDGTPYLAYQDGGNGNKATVMKFNGTAWTLVGPAGFSADVAWSSCLAFAPDGTPYIGYSDKAKSYFVTVMKFNGTNWVAVGTAGFTAGAADFPTLAFARDGTPFVTYSDHATSQRATVMKYNGSAWVVVGAAGFSDNAASNPCMAIAPDGTPYVTYTDTGHSQRATVMKYNGSAWGVVGTAGFSAAGANSPSLAIAPNGSPFIAFQDASSYKATVMGYDGSAWVTIGTAAISSGSGDYPSLVFSPNGTPYISFEDGGNGYKVTLMKLGVPAPTVSAVSPTTGSALGGTSVTITGTHLTGTTAVQFGSTPATGFTVNSATQITATAPVGSVGASHVTVTTSGGTSATSAADRFTYAAPVLALTVTNSTDSGAGSLRGALAALDSGGTITFDASLSGQTITLASQLAITKNLTIDGSALDSHVRISGGGVTTVFSIGPAVTVSLVHLDIVNGDGTSNSGNGGGILVNGGTLTVQDCTLSGNTAGATGFGGGIANLGGTLTVQNCTFSGNSAATGGGIVSNATLTIINSTFSGNQATGTGANTGGGAIYEMGGTVAINHTTITGNLAAAPNTAGSGIRLNAGTLTLKNSIVANNGASGTSNFSVVLSNWFTTQGYNLSNNWSGLPTTTGDLTGNPSLSPLADNGGPTQTCALQAGSPALNAADPTDPTETDQRGVSRPQVGRSDIGAFEAVVGVAAIDVPSNGIYAAGQALDFTVHFNSAVTVDRSSGTPRIALNIGGNTVYADYASGSGTADLVFHYTVQAGDVDTDGIAVGSAIDLNGGTILSTVGSSPVALILPGVGSTSGVHVATPPTLTKPTISNLGANQVTFTFRSSATGTGYFTLLIDSETAGTAAQTAVGQNASGTTAYRHGSLPLTAVTNGTYTVSNLTENTHYTLCFTAENGGALAGADASVSFTTTAATNLTRMDWALVGAAGFSARGAIYTSLAIAPDGTPYVLYADAANSNKATVMKFNGTAWTVVGTAGFSAGDIDFATLAFAPDGTPYIATMDHVTYGASVMKYTGGGTTGWELVGAANFSAGSMYYSDLVFAPDGTPYLAFRDDNHSYKATVMKFNGTAWVAVGPVSFTSGVANDKSLAIAPDGTPYLAYQDTNNGGKVTVMKFNGTAWTLVGTAGFSAGSGNYESMQFAPDGTPYVAYRDAGNSNKATVLKFDGTAWTVVGTAGFSAGAIDFATLAFAPDGMPCVAYRDAGNSNKATVMKFNGTAWTVVGTAGFSAGGTDDTTLVFAPDGTPYLAYTDEGNLNKATVMKLAPAVTSVAVPTAGTYGVGQALPFTVNYSRPVMVTGMPKLAITIGSSVRDVLYTGGSGTSALTFSYTVRAGDTDTDGIAIGSAITLNGGTLSGVLKLTGVGSTTGVLIDSTAPAAPIISTVTATKLGGTAEAGSQVFVYDGSTLLSTTIAGSDGKWSLTVTLLDGVHTLTATACDAGANFSSVSSAITPLIDTVAPVAPVVSTISAVTNNTTPTISGTAEAGSTVKIYDGSTLLGTTTTASDGTWSLLVTLTDGTHNLTATATDSVGNVGSASSAITPTIDTVAPSAPVFTTTTISTNDTTPALSGTAEAGSMVKIYDGATLVGTTTVGSDGTWSFTPTLALSEGSHAITAKATDVAGNTSATSSAVTLTIDITAPATPAINNVGSTTISGTAEAGSTVKIYDSSTLLGTTTTASDGTWSLLVTLTDGMHSLTATATDSVGNAGSASSAITPTIDTVAPSAPVFSNASGNTTAKTPILAGMAEPSSTVKLYDGTTLLGTTTASGTGAWSFAMTAALTEGTHSLAAKATDAAGNTSNAAVLTLVVGTAPVITSAPAAKTVAAGSSVSLAVSASGTATLGYQWQKSADNTTFAAISAANAATYAVSSATVAHTGYYRVVVTNSFGTATSASALLTVTPAFTDPKPDGSAASVTGGSGTGSQSVAVLTADDFRFYATASTPYVITVAGTLNIGTVNVTSNKTIQGADGNAALLGNLTLGTGVSNVIIRGLNLTNPGTTIVNGAYTDGGDGLTLSGASNVFVTHATFFDCADHAIKIINGSDNITVSWCEFYNTSSTLLHRISVQIGNSSESKPLHVTLHHNWWSTNVDQQMPLSTYGYVHQYNNSFASAGATSGTIASDQSQLFSERNVYTGLANPLTKQTVSAALTAGKIRVIGNVYTNCTGTAPDAGTDTVFTPPYSYEMLPTSDVATEVSTFAGNTAGAGSTDAATGTATVTGPTAAVLPGASFTLTAAPSGFTATTYQWRLNNAEIAGATASTYTSANTQAANAGTYTVAISMASGDTVVSTPLVLTLGEQPKSETTGTVSGSGSFEAWFCAALVLLGSLRFVFRRCR